MTLPDLSHISTIEELRAENTRLLGQANKMLAATNVLEILGSNMSLPKISGSYNYELMVYPDIDCYVSDEKVTKEKIAHITSALLMTDYIRKMSVVNTDAFPPRLKGLPRGFWIGLEIPFEGESWGIDCWFLKPEWVTINQNLYEERLRNASNEQKDAILLIKHWLITSNTYGKHLHQSTDVYDAVLDSNVLTIDDYKNYIH